MSTFLYAVVITPLAFLLGVFMSGPVKQVLAWGAEKIKNLAG